MQSLSDILLLDGAEAPLQPRMVQIFTEACRLFAERGFEGTAMRDIAEVCGISKPTLYHYFADKDAIVRPLMLGITRIIHDRVAARHGPVASSTGTAPAVHGGERILLRDYRWAWIASASIFWNDPHERHRAERLEWRDRYEGLLRGILHQAMTRGETGTMDVSLAGRLVLSTLNWLPRWYDPSGPLRPMEIAERFYAMLLHGLQNRSGDDPSIK